MTPKISPATPATTTPTPKASPAQPKLAVAKPGPPLIPPAVGGLQYNACKNPKCPQFGLPATTTQGSGNGAAGPYSIASGGKGYPLLKCSACGETPPLKSNKGIAEEVERLSAYLKPELIFCPNDKPNKETGELCRNN